MHAGHSCAFACASSVYGERRQPQPTTAAARTTRCIIIKKLGSVISELKSWSCYVYQHRKVRYSVRAKSKLLLSGRTPLLHLFFVGCVLGALLFSSKVTDEKQGTFPDALL